MSEIKTCHVITRNPTSKGDLGACEIGYYTVSDGILTVVTGAGEPLRGASGERITERLVLGGESERAVAMRLALGHWRSGRDETADAFNRPLSYGPSGLV
jgi:hypothetical protein